MLLMLRRLLNDFLYTSNCRASFAFPRKQLKALGFGNQQRTVGLQGGWTPTHRATAVSPLSQKLLVGWFKGRLSRREGCFILASVSPKPPKPSFHPQKGKTQGDISDQWLWTKKASLTSHLLKVYFFSRKMRVTREDQRPTAVGPAAKRAAMGTGHWPRGHSQAQATSTGEVTGQYNASNNYGKLNWCHQFSAEMRMKTNLEVQKRTSWCNSITYNL